MRRFLVLTAGFHTVLAVGVLLHARRRDRSAGKWIALTLAFGLGGVAGYLFAGH
ncbi:hypothetical protein [Halalkalicoccus subterraneus]|uniref:hypothetical protein n=1 Tax=Halalkalicoccus subterraneus TaxID=2675002 RepID=UPI001B87931F|nr:hypothetical protein [Halalkalicoccus subterraneus]